MKRRENDRNNKSINGYVMIFQGQRKKDFHVLAIGKVS
jgi:hypothetical protein